MGKQCCICKRKLNFWDIKMPIAGNEAVCELCLKRADLFKSKYSISDFKEFQGITRRDLLHLMEDSEVMKDTFFEVDGERYCSKCNNLILQMDEFCPNCGGNILNISREINAVDYVGENMMGCGGKEFELKLKGIRIKQKNLQKFIHYSHILDVEFVKASYGAKGFLSIITNDGGIIGNCNILKPSDCMTALHDQNTIVFSKKLNEQAEKIYSAILELMKCSELEDDANDINNIDFMTGLEFESFCANLLKKNRFYNVKVTKGSGDQGVDVLAEKDGIKYAIQCKFYSTPLGNTPIQEVVAGKSFYDCHVGVVMTNSTFTPGAKELAKATNTLLWDGKKLDEFLKR